MPIVPITQPSGIAEIKNEKDLEVKDILLLILKEIKDMKKDRKDHH